MTPALPPSSRITRFFPARAFMPQPTGDEPVNVSSLNRSSLTSRSPVFRSIGKTLIAPGGSPDSSSSRPRFRALSGVLVAGFSTIGLPAATAGASLCAVRLSGKLKGEMAATGPMGNRACEREAPLAVLGEIHRDHFAANPARLFGRHMERHRGAIGLDQRVLDRFASLPRHDPGNGFALSL